MSRDLAWLGDDGKTVDRFNPEQVARAIVHLFLTGDVVSGLLPLDDLSNPERIAVADPANHDDPNDLSTPEQDRRGAPFYDHIADTWRDTGNRGAAEHAARSTPEQDR